MIADSLFARKLPLMMHALNPSEELCCAKGAGVCRQFWKAGIEWSTPGRSTVQHLKKHGILRIALLTHCINVMMQEYSATNK